MNNHKEGSAVNFLKALTFSARELCLLSKDKGRYISQIKPLNL